LRQKRNEGVSLDKLMSKDTPTRDRWQKRSLKSALVLGAAVLIVLVLTTVTSGWLLYRAGLNDWKEDLSMLSTILTESTAQTLGSARLVLDGIAADLEQAKISDQTQLRKEVGTAHFARILDEKIRNLPQIAAAAVVDASGQVIALSREFPAPLINVSDREYFIHHVQDLSRQEYVSEVNTARYNGTQNFYMSQRLNGKDGRFLGIIVVALPSAFFERFFANISKEKPFSITLYRSDYKPLATNYFSGSANTDLVQRPSVAEPKEARRLLTSEHQDGGKAVFYQNAYSLGIQRVVRDNPVLVDISVTGAVYFEEWLQSMYPVIAVAAVSLVALIAAFLIALRLLKRRDEDAQVAIHLKGEADAANAAKSRFLAMVSHEIRTPMNGMLGLTELMLESDLSPLQKQYADGIHSASGGLVRIINDILDLSKIESGKMDLESVAFSPAHLVRDVVELYEPSARKKGLNLEVLNHCPPEILLFGDSARLAQVLGNLLSNAIKFTEAGYVSISAAVSPCQNGVHTLEFAIVDSGIGISDEAIKTLFEPFSQADNSIFRRFGGTGLGLTICKHLVEMMGGAITCQSTPGVSTTFEFQIKCIEAALATQPISGPSLNRMPVVDVSSRQVELPTPAREGQAGAAVSMPVAGIPALSILVAEDTEINRQLVRLLLGKLGVQPREAVNGKEAVEAVHAEKFDLIFMDCMMPMMDGYEATRLIRSYENGENLTRTPIVALTASAIEGDRQRCLDAGMDDYLSKPFSSTKLIEIINKWTGGDFRQKQQ
jgi:two-component system, sensor histidine kinase